MLPPFGEVVLIRINFHQTMCQGSASGCLARHWGRGFCCGANYLATEELDLGSGGREVGLGRAECRVAHSRAQIGGIGEGLHRTEPRLIGYRRQ